jgi:hypothetical protein
MRYEGANKPLMTLKVVVKETEPSTDHAESIKSDSGSDKMSTLNNQKPQKTMESKVRFSKRGLSCVSSVNFSTNANWCSTMQYVEM